MSGSAALIAASRAVTCCFIKRGDSQMCGSESPCSSAALLALLDAFSCSSSIPGRSVTASDISTTVIFFALRSAIFVSAHDSRPAPFMTKTSEFSIVAISFGVGSKSCASTPLPVRLTTVAALPTSC